MPSVHVFSNVSKASVVTASALRALSKSLSVALDSPEPSVLVQLSLDQPMLFAGSDAPCAFIHIRSIGKIDAEHNPKTAQALTATVTDVLGVPAERVFMNLSEVAASNWGAKGTTVNNLKK
uniref:L-dopachrome isomerase n=1 Tax=Globisporangium ultimum (strain ATCC 200006 / CBS 805.95 / DAOM BR144) TaxID=431595 RepID=K3XCN0_GLOUD